MNRIIKFRVWDKNKKVMIVSFPHDTNWELQNDPYITMQFTGLKDKNGKEIYEGDIVEWWQTGIPENVFKYQVVFNTARFMLANGFMDVQDLDTNQKYSQIQVVGNIYENKDLLK